MPVGGADDFGHARSWLGRLAFAVGWVCIRAQLWRDFGVRRVRRGALQPRWVIAQPAVVAAAAVAQDARFGSRACVWLWYDE